MQQHALRRVNRNWALIICRFFFPCNEKKLKLRLLKIAPMYVIWNRASVGAIMPKLITSISKERYSFYEVVFILKER